MHQFCLLLVLLADAFSNEPSGNTHDVTIAISGDSLSTRHLAPVAQLSFQSEATSNESSTQKQDTADEPRDHPESNAERTGPKPGMSVDDPSASNPEAAASTTESSVDQQTTPEADADSADREVAANAEESSSDSGNGDTHENVELSGGEDASADEENSSTVADHPEGSCHEDTPCNGGGDCIFGRCKCEQGYHCSEGDADDEGACREQGAGCVLFGHSHGHGQEAHAHEHKGHSHEHVHPHIGLLFLFFSLTVGALTLHALTRLLPTLPYTCALLVEGFVLGAAHSYFSDEESNFKVFGDLSRSLEMWADINPHLMLFTFLPALIYGDSMSLRWHLVQKTLGQCLLLACPGVLLGVVATGLLAFYGPFGASGYGWDIYQCMTLGSILAATDPVAVVSILQELGASPKLTMVISGESLLNDGTAIVCFNIFKALAVGGTALRDIWLPGEEVLPSRLVLYFLWMSVGGIVFGIMMGGASVVWVAIASRKTSHIDALIQLTVSVSSAYLTFFIAEVYLGVSGVLATVACAVVVATVGWQHFNSVETVKHVWHMMEYVGNTLIFMLSGLIMGVKLMSNQYLGIIDVVYLLLMYAGCTMIRFGMVFLFFPLMRRMGYGFKVADGVMLSWGGLRGAVGLALALDCVDVFPGARAEKHTVQILFHVGGIASLTLLVNGILSATVMDRLGMTKPDEVKESVIDSIKDKMNHHCYEVLKHEAELLGLSREQQKLIVQRCHCLQEVESAAEFRNSLIENHQARKSQGRPHSVSLSQRSVPNGQESETEMAFTTGSNVQKMQCLRDIFLTAVKHSYSHQVHMGVLPEGGPGTVVLDESVEHGFDNSHLGLRDVDYVLLHKSASGWFDFIKEALPGNRSAKASAPTGSAHQRSAERSGCFIFMSFIEAHDEAREVVKGFLKDTDESSNSEGLAVIEESRDAVDQVEHELAKVRRKVRDDVSALRVACIVLEHQRKFIEDMHEHGTINAAQAEKLLEHLDEEMIEVRALEHQSDHTVEAEVEVELGVIASASKH